MGSVSVSSCRCCMFVSCVHPVAVHQYDQKNIPSSWPIVITSCNLIVNSDYRQ